MSSGVGSEMIILPMGKVQGLQTSSSAACRSHCLQYRIWYDMWSASKVLGKVALCAGALVCR
jgi:hypothetical protein